MPLPLQLKRVLRNTLLVVSIVGATSHGYSQTTESTPTTQNTSPAADDSKALVLTPFEVIADKGYAVTNSQVATGFNRDLKRTPLAVNIISEEFIREAGFTSYSDLADYLPGVVVDPNPLGGNSTAYARGQATSFYSQDGRRYYTDPVVGEGGRLEVIKGPATMFFGRAQPGGILNFSTPPPSAERRINLTTTYGSFDKSLVSVSAQGPLIPKKKWLSYRLDGEWKEGDEWVDHSFSDRKFIRGTVGIRPFKNFDMRLSYEKTETAVSGSMRAPFLPNPLYLSDWNNPRPEQIAWAKAPGRAVGGAAATDAAAVTFLKSRWRESSANWAADNVSIYSLTQALARFVGYNDAATPYGWDYNDSLIGSFGSTDLQQWGGQTTYTPFKFLSIKASYYKYDLDRVRNFVSLNTLSADGVYRGTPSSTRFTNDSSTRLAEAIGTFGGKTLRQIVHVGASLYKETYFQYNAPAASATIPLNSIPGDIRTSSGAIVTPGWNPFTTPYPDISIYLPVRADDLTAASLTQRNRDEAFYASSITELFDGRAGLLAGGRRQKYKDDVTGFHSDKDVYTLGLSYEVIPEVYLYASTSTSFEPSNQAYVEGAGTTVAERLAAPAPPRTGRGWDIGAKWSILERKLSGTVTVFETTRVNDFRTLDQLATDNDPRNQDAITTNNVNRYTYGGSRLSRGLETELMYQPNQNLVVIGMFSYMPVSKIVANPSLAKITLGNGTSIINPQTSNQIGQRSANSPEYKASLWTRYKFSNGSLRGLMIGYGISYSDELETSADPGVQVRAPAYTLSRATIDYAIKPFGQNVNLSLLASNLFNEKYYRSSARGEPFSLTLKASVAF